MVGEGTGAGADPGKDDGSFQKIQLLVFSKNAQYNHIHNIWPGIVNLTHMHAAIETLEKTCIQSPISLQRLILLRSS